MSPRRRLVQALLSFWTGLLVLVSGVALSAPAATADEPNSFGGRFPVNCRYDVSGVSSSLDWTASISGTTLTLEVTRMPQQPQSFPGTAVTPHVTVVVDGVRFALAGTSAVESGNSGAPLTGNRALSADIGVTDVDEVRFVRLEFTDAAGARVFRCDENAHGWTGTLSGTVSGPAGFDPTKVMVSVYGYPQHVTTPDAQGRWSLEAPTGHQRLEFRSSEPGLLTLFYPGAVEPYEGEQLEVPRNGTLSGLDLTMGRGATLNVTVAGQPADEEVVIDLEEKRWGYWSLRDTVTLAEAQHAAAFTGLAPGTYRVWAGTETHARQRSAAYDLVLGQTVDVPPLTLVPGGRLQFQLSTRSGGQPTYSAVQVFGEEGDDLVAQVVGQGQDTLVTPPLLPGNYRLRVAIMGERYTEFWYAVGEDDVTPVTVRAGETATIAVSEPAAASIAGTITSDGGPVADARVELYRADDAYAYYSVRTDGAGRYQFEGLPPGTWRVVAKATGLSSGWFGGTERTTATPITLRAGTDLVDKDITLTSVSVSGRIVTGKGAPVAGVAVWMYADDGQSGGEAVTAADGTYRVEGLERLLHRVYLYDPTGRVGAYDNQSGDPENSNTVDLASGSVSGVDAVLRPPAGHARVGGEVVLPEGIAASSAYVQVFRALDGSSYGEYTRVSVNGGEWSASLAPGTYKFRSGSYDGNYGGQWYGGQNLDEAQEVVLAEGDDETGIDLALHSAGTINTGALVYSSVASDSVLETLKKNASGDGWTLVHSLPLQFAINTTQTVGGLAAGTYVQRVRSLNGAHDTVWAGGSSTLEGAKRITVRAGATASAGGVWIHRDYAMASGRITVPEGVDASQLVVSRELEIGGTWYDQGRVHPDADGNWISIMVSPGRQRLTVTDPQGRLLSRTVEFTAVREKLVENVSLTLPPAAKVEGAVSGPGDLTRFTVTAVQGETRVQSAVSGDGSYELRGLEAGAHQILVEDTEQVLPTRGANGRVSAEGSPVRLEVGEALDLDVEMGPGATIRGTTALLGGLSSDDVTADLFRPEPGGDGELIRVASAPLDADGAWRFTGLEADEYTVKLVAAGAVLPTTVVLEERTVGVNSVVDVPTATVTAEASISGRISGADDLPAGITVVLRGEGVEKFGTLDNGHYRIGGLAAGDYRVMVYDADGNLPSRGLDGRRTTDGTRVTLVAGQALTGQDVRMGPGASFAGTVTLLGGLTPADVEVTLREAVEEDGETVWKKVESKPLAGDSTWSFTGAEAGTYRVVVGSSDDAFSPKIAVNGAVVTVTSSVTGTPVTLRARGTLSGEVTGYPGADVSGVEVLALDAESAEVVARTQVAADRSWSFAGLEPGEYRVKFVDGADAVRTSFLGWVGDRASARVLELAPGEALTGLVHDLDPRGSISGTVTLPAGADHGDVEVRFQKWITEGSERKLGEPLTAAVDADGGWRSPRLAAGTYVIRYVSAVSSMATRWHGGVTRASDAEEFVVDDFDARTGVKHAMARTGSISGVVRVPSGFDASTIEVRAQRASDPADGSPQWSLAGTVRAGQDGTYRLAGLEAGRYRLSFVDTQQVLTTVHGRGVAVEEEAEVIDLALGEEVLGQDVTLQAVPAPAPSASPSASPSGLPSPSITTSPTSAPTLKVIVAKKAPRVSGKARVGRTLAATKGTWKAKGSRVTFQWQLKRPGKKPVAVAKGKKATVKIKPNHRGARLRVVVTVKAPGFRTRTYTAPWSKKVA